MQELQGRQCILECVMPATTGFESRFIPVHRIALKGREKTEKF